MKKAKKSTFISVEKKCDTCGKTMFVQPCMLKRGQGRFCSRDCFHKYWDIKKVINETGKKYGRWTVLEYSHTKSKNAYFKCKCDCGIEKIVRGRSLRTGQSKSCGCLNREQKSSWIGEKAHNWKGGKITTYGYTLVKNRQHPNASKDGYIAEHRLIMAEILGRPLKDNELVHHKNGIRDDNRIENLELLTYSNHHGEVICPHCQKKFLLK